MIPQQVIAKICNDERLNVPFYKHLDEFLAMDELPQQQAVELVNDTNDISALLFEPQGTFIQQRFHFNPADHDQLEIRTAINTFRDLYRMTLDEKLALDLTDTEYAAFAYQFDTCFLVWLLSQVLESL